MKAILICGSRNPQGQTAQAGEAVLEGLKAHGAQVQTALLPQMRIEHCRQCDQRGWGICRQEGRCVIEDDFGQLVEQIRSADVVVFATPVYCADLSDSLRVFLDRFRRTIVQDQARAAVAGKRAIGVCVAGGGGGGAPFCSFNLDNILRTCGFDVVDVVPVRRQNLQLKLEVLRMTGTWLATPPSPQA